jgi:calmodulin
MSTRDLTEDEVADLKEAFCMFDLDGSGEWERRRTANRAKSVFPAPVLNTLASLHACLFSASKDQLDANMDAHSRLSCWFTGRIELKELQQVMKKLGQNPTEAELIEMINSVDDNGDNEIDFNEFLVLMKYRISDKDADPDKELRDAFAVFDTDGSGSIDRRELKKLMKKLGQALSDKELEAMMDEVDTDGDGEISFAEFKAMMM